MTNTIRAWQRMLSGRKLNILEPCPTQIEIEDIARGLSRQARWNGQTIGEHSFSVAQHSIYVEKVFNDLFPNYENEYKIFALLHDAAEYVIGDMISPFKKRIGEDYKSIENNLEEKINQKFNIPTEIPHDIKKDIKKCDLISCYNEAIQIAGFSKEDANQHILKDCDYIFEINQMSNNEAMEKFINRFNELYKNI